MGIYFYFIYLFIYLKNFFIFNFIPSFFLSSSFLHLTLSVSHSLPLSLPPSFSLPLSPFLPLLFLSLPSSFLFSSLLPPLSLTPFLSLLSLSTDEDSKRPRSLSDRWNDVIKRLELWVEIMELNDQGEYVAVELQPKADIKSGGIFQIRQVCTGYGAAAAAAAMLRFDLNLRFQHVQL